MIDLTSKCVNQWKLNDNLPTSNVIDNIGSNDGSLYSGNSEDAHQDSGNPPNLNGCFKFPFLFTITSQIGLVGNWSVVFWVKGNKENPGIGAGSVVFGDNSQSGNYFAMLNGIKTLYVDDSGETWQWGGDTNFYNVWRFVVLTFEFIAGGRGNLELFFDGASQAVKAPVWGIFYFKHVGTGAASPGNFDGWIDNFMVFDDLLAQAEIDFLYNHGLGTERLKSVARPLVGGSLAGGRKGLV